MATNVAQNNGRMVNMNLPTRVAPTEAEDEGP